MFLLFVSLACSSPQATPQKVGSVSDKPTAKVQPTEAPQANSTQVVEQPTQVPPTNTPAGPQAYKVGDIVNIGDNVLVVLGWQEVKGDQFAKPEAGKKFVAIDALIVNKSKSAASISTLMQMSLKDSTGQKYNLDLMATTATKGGSLDGEIAPGERVRGKVGFQIPENVQGLQFVFDASLFGTGKVIVDLGASPMAVEPPAELAGETKQPTFKIGDIANIGAFALTVNGVTTPAGDQFSKPNAGNKFVVVDVTLENKGTKSENVSSMLQMSLKDSAGTQYKVDLMAVVASKGTSPDGELAVGEKLRGQVGFQVPENATGLVFVFDASIFGSGKILVTLQ